MENLNSPSAEFKPYSEVGSQFGEHAHGWHALVSELSMLAMGAESQKQMEVKLRIHCLGGGLVGSFVTRRLVEAGFEVHLYDIVERETAATFHLCDAFSADHSSADIIVNMLPGSLGNQMTKSLNNTGQKIVDLSFSETTPDQLIDVSSSILWDVGIAPGLSNMLVAKAVREFGELDEVSIKVGGNPQQPDSEWSYMAPFSPHDVIAEYTRCLPAVRDGSQVRSQL